LAAAVEVSSDAIVFGEHEKSGDVEPVWTNESEKLVVLLRTGPPHIAEKQDCMKWLCLRSLAVPSACCRGNVLEEAFDKRPPLLAPSCAQLPIRRAVSRQVGKSKCVVHCEDIHVGRFPSTA
jgi:hypothetical protein